MLASITEGVYMGVNLRKPLFTPVSSMENFKLYKNMFGTKRKGEIRKCSLSKTTVL